MILFLFSETSRIGNPKETVMRLVTAVGGGQGQGVTVSIAGRLDGNVMVKDKFTKN